MKEKKEKVMLQGRWKVNRRISPIFAGIPPELSVVSEVVKIKCDLIFGCKIYLMFVKREKYMVNYLIFEC